MTFLTSFYIQISAQRFRKLQSLHFSAILLMRVYKVPWWYVSFLNSAIGFSNPNVAEWLLHFVVANKEWSNLISFFILPFPAVLLKGQVSLQQESICWLNGDCWDCWDNFSGISCIDACTVIIVSISSFIPLYMFLCHIASKFSRWIWKVKH